VSRKNRRWQAGVGEDRVQFSALRKKIVHEGVYKDWVPRPTRYRRRMPRDDFVIDI